MLFQLGYYPDIESSLVALVVFMLLVAEFYYRRAVDRPAHQGRPYGAGKPPLTKNLKLMSIGLCLSTLLLFIRSVFTFADRISAC